MGVEYELKYAATGEKLAAIRQHFALEYTTFRMKTTYFDTPGGELSIRHITLRLRQENDVTVCTVKTPLSDSSRGEWECQCDDISQGVENLCKLGAPEELLAWTAAGLVSVCEAAFTRRAGIVKYKDAKLELALDEGKLMGGGREMPLCEVEVELKEGSTEAADMFGAFLADMFALEAEPRSKFRRALVLARGEAYGL